MDIHPSRLVANNPTVPASKGSTHFSWKTASRSLMLVFLFLLVRLAVIARMHLSGDEGIFGLMALAIGRGEEYPLYCWSAHYASALISYLAVPTIALWGPTVFAMKAAILPYGIVTVILIYLALRRSFGELDAFLSAMAFAIPLPTWLIFSVASHGGYPEIYFLGFALWVVALGILRRSTATLWMLWGFLAGAVISIYWLGIPFILSSLTVLVIRRSIQRREAWGVVPGALMGGLPFLYYNFVIAPAATLKRLGGRALEATPDTPLVHAVMKKVGDVPAWFMDSIEGTGILFAPMGGFVGFAAILALTIWGARKLKARQNDWGSFVPWFLIYTLAFHLVGGLTRDRHWTIILFPFLVAVHGLPRVAARILLALLILVDLGAFFSMLPTMQQDSRIPVVLAALERESASALVADYDLGNPIAFASGGRVLISTMAPPNAFDRRPDWTDRVRHTRRPGVLLPSNLVARNFETWMLENGIPFARREVADRLLYFPETSGAAVMEWLSRDSGTAPAIENSGQHFSERRAFTTN